MTPTPTHSQVAPGVEFLLHSYPEFVTIESLPLDNLEDRVCARKYDFIICFDNII